MVNAVKLISNPSLHVVVCLVMSCFAIRILMHVRSGLNMLYLHVPNLMQINTVPQLALRGNEMHRLLFC